MVMRAPKAGSRGNFHFRRPWLLPCSLPDQTIRPRPRTEEIDNPATNQAQKMPFLWLPTDSVGGQGRPLIDGNEDGKIPGN
jgi:hypothetical protein